MVVTSVHCVQPVIVAWQSARQFGCVIDGRFEEFRKDLRTLALPVRWRSFCVCNDAPVKSSNLHKKEEKDRRSNKQERAKPLGKREYCHIWYLDFHSDEREKKDHNCP